jgi:hypothetical protein
MSKSKPMMRMRSLSKKMGLEDLKKHTEAVSVLSRFLHSASEEMPNEVETVKSITYNDITSAIVVKLEFIRTTVKVYDYSCYQTQVNLYKLW